MKIILTDTARLPLKVCRGGEIKRNKLASTYNQMLFNELSSFKDNHCPLDEFKKALNKIIGKYNIKYEIENINNSELFNGAIAALTKIPNIKTTLGSSTPITLFIEGFKFHLPIHKNIITNKSSALHEARHFFDHICNPKTTTLHGCKLGATSHLSETKLKIHNLFLNTYNSDLGLLAETSYMHLQDLPDKVAIDTLQEIRHSLKSEINAYTDEIKFLSKSKADISEINDIRETLRSYKFKEKLKLANAMLKERLIEMWTKRAGDVPTLP